MRKEGSSSAICVQGTRRVGGGRQKTFHGAPCQCMETGTLGRRTGPHLPCSKVFNPKAAVSPINYAPASPRPSETSWYWGNGACLERDKPLPLQELLGQARKSKERLRDKSPLKPSKKQGMCPFRGGCGYVRTQFKGLDVFWSPLKASSREPVEQNISRGCKHLLKR